MGLQANAVAFKTQHGNGHCARKSIKEKKEKKESKEAASIGQFNRLESAG